MAITGVRSISIIRSSTTSAKNISAPPPKLPETVSLMLFTAKIKTKK
jgi:hypothetical protein